MPSAPEYINLVRKPAAKQTTVSVQQQQQQQQQQAMYNTANPRAMDIPAMKAQDFSPRPVLPAESSFQSWQGTNEGCPARIDVPLASFPVWPANPAVFRNPWSVAPPNLAMPQQYSPMQSGFSFSAASFLGQGSYPRDPNQKWQGGNNISSHGVGNSPGNSGNYGSGNNNNHGSGNNTGNHGSGNNHGGHNHGNYGP
jgi:hypothetical protein